MLFEIDPKPLGEELTALGGVPLVVRAFRSLGLPAAIAYIPEESVELQGLGRVNRSLVQELGSRCAG